MDIYSPVQVTASDQKEGFGSIWKPTDGVIGPAMQASWMSLQSSHSWWQMKLPRRSVVSSVVIYIPSSFSASVAKSAMNGFAVHIGDLPVNSGSRNSICGKPWEQTATSVIAINCTGSLIGSYLLVAAADRQGSALCLTEIEVYGCEGYCLYRIKLWVVLYM